MNESTRKTGGQVEAFRKAAREIGCDESEANFVRKLSVIAKSRKGGGPPKSRRRRKTTSS